MAHVPHVPGCPVGSVPPLRSVSLPVDRAPRGCGEGAGLDDGDELMSLDIDLAEPTGHPAVCSTCYRAAILPTRLVGFYARCYDSSSTGSSRRVQICSKCLLELLAVVVGQ